MVSSICKHVAQPSKDPEATGLSQAGTHTDQRGPEEHHSFTPLLSSFQHPKVKVLGVSLLICRYLQRPVDICCWPSITNGPLSPPQLGQKWNMYFWEGARAH